MNGGTVERWNAGTTKFERSKGSAFIPVWRHGPIRRPTINNWPRIVTDETDLNGASVNGRDG